MSLTEVPIPSGGRAWVRTRLSHERATARRSVLASVITGRQLRTLTAAAGRGAPAADPADLIDDIDLAEALKAQARARADSIRLCTHHWEGVFGTDGEELVFPADVEQLDDADFDALYTSCEAALAGPDPKATPAP